MDNEIKLKTSIETFDKTAIQFQKRFMELNLYNDSLDQFCRLIKQDNADVFEIGTGPGNVTKYLKSKRPDFNIWGIDLAPNMVKLAKENNPSESFEVMDCRNIGAINQIFDAIMCAFCLPFLSKEEVRQFIKDSYNILKNSAVIYLSTMEDNYEKSGYETTSFSGADKIFFYYHQFDFLEACLCDAGFEIVDFKRQAYPESDGTSLTDLIIIAKKS